MNNVSPIGQTAIQNQINIMSCQLPIREGVYSLITDQITHSKDINGNTTSNTEDMVGTFFDCYPDPVTGAPTISTIIKQYSANCYSVIPCGWFGFASDYMTVLGQKATALSIIVLYFVTPINFNILGYDISDIGGVGLIFVSFFYAFAYLGIGLFLWNGFRRGWT